MRIQLRNHLWGALSAVALFAALPLPAEAEDKPVIETAADLPRTTFTLEAKPSILVMEGGAAFDAVADAVKRDVDAVLSGYTIQDAAATRALQSALLAVAFTKKDWTQVISLVETLKALEDKPAARETTGLLSGSYAQAALNAGTDGGEAFSSAFRTVFTDQVAQTNYELAQDNLQAIKGQFEVLSTALLQGGLEGALDANAEAQNMTVGRDFAASIVSARMTLAYVSLKDIIVDVLSTRIAAETKEKVDRWSERLASLEGRDDLSEVVIAIWDSGTDPSVFPGKMWTNPGESANGQDNDGNGFVDDIHGIAFDPSWAHTTGALRPMPEDDLAVLGQSTVFLKGNLDLQASQDTPEAQALRQYLSTLKPEEVLPFQLRMGRLTLYAHGTATGHVAQRLNPAARLMHVRFNYKVQPVPQPVDEEAAERFSAHVEDTIAYLKAHDVRVVNMSWRITAPQIEASLASIEPDTERRRERALAIFETMNQALVDGFTAAPQILFVPGAGNEDENVEFVKSFPAGINLPNVITVGAIDVSLEPASFTSYGSSIDLYSNGFEVPSVIPGGEELRVSGTSLAAPQVANLAGQILAFDPELSVAGLRQLIEETATEEGERGLKVIHPKAALAAQAGQ